MQHIFTPLVALLVGVAVITSGAPPSRADSAAPDSTSTASPVPYPTESTANDAGTEPPEGEVDESTASPSEESPTPTTTAEPSTTGV